MSYSDAIVAQAKLWVGYRAGPGNQNMFSAGLGLPPEAWCQDFVQFVSASAGYKHHLGQPGHRPGQAEEVTPGNGVRGPGPAACRPALASLLTDRPLPD